MDAEKSIGGPEPDGSMSLAEQWKAVEDRMCLPLIQAMYKLLSMTDEQYEAERSRLTEPPTSGNTCASAALKS